MNSATRLTVLALAFAAGGCATTSTSDPRDPFESYNRAMFTFNDKLDEFALKPAAQAYSKLPSFVQTGVGNFFGNLWDVWTGVNNFLQGKVADGFSDVMRVAVNTTLGIGGVLDIGSEAGLAKHKEDFGQTLGVWGVKSGPYVVLPVLGPSTLRDTGGTVADFFVGDPWQYKSPVRWRNTGTVVRAVDQRASVLGAVNLLEEAALDRYVFVRDAYLQRRESLIHDGETKKSTYEDDIGPAPVVPENAGESNSLTLGNVSSQSTEPLVKTVVNKE